MTSCNGPPYFLSARQHFILDTPKRLLLHQKIQMKCNNMRHLHVIRFAKRKKVFSRAETHKSFEILACGPLDHHMYTTARVFVLQKRASVMLHGMHFNAELRRYVLIPVDKSAESIVGHKVNALQRSPTCYR